MTTRRERLWMCVRPRLGGPQDDTYTHTPVAVVHYRRDLISARERAAHLLLSYGHERHARPCVAAAPAPAACGVATSVCPPLRATSTIVSPASDFAHAVDATPTICYPPLMPLATPPPWPPPQPDTRAQAGGQMHVLSSAQFASLLGRRAGDPGTLLDVGAGDGNVTAKMAPLFGAVVATEASPVMTRRLSEMGYTCVRAVRACVRA